MCGVCHTELDEIEGRTPPPKLPVVLGHQVVGYVEQLGEHAAGFARGIVLELPGFTTRVAGVSNVLPATRICVRSSARRDEMWMVAMRST